MTLSPVVFALALVGAAAVAFFIGWIAHKRIGEGKVYNAEELAQKILREAERDASFRANQLLAQARLEKKIALSGKDGTSSRRC